MSTSDNVLKIRLRRMTGLRNKKENSFTKADERELHVIIEQNPSLVLSGTRGLILLQSNINNGSPDLIFFSKAKRQLVLIELKTGSLSRDSFKQVGLKIDQVVKKLNPSSSRYKFIRQKRSCNDYLNKELTSDIKQQRKLIKLVRESKTVRRILVGSVITKKNYLKALNEGIEPILVQKSKAKDYMGKERTYWASIVLA